MDGYEWTDSLHAELAFFMENIDAKITSVDVEICSADLAVHLPGKGESCSYCSHCTGSFSSETVSTITGTNFFPCSKCFPDYTGNHYSTALFQIHNSLRMTRRDSEFTLLEAVVSLLNEVYGCLYTTATTLPGNIRDALDTLAEMIKGKAIKALVKEQVKCTETDVDGWMVCDMQKFYECVYLNTPRPAFESVLMALVNERAAASGLSALRANPTLLSALPSSYYALTDKVPSAAVLRETRTFMEDGMTLNDAYVCAAALA